MEMNLLYRLIKLCHRTINFALNFGLTSSEARFGALLLEKSRDGSITSSHSGYVFLNASS